MVNSAGTLTKSNNLIQNVVTKSDASKQESSSSGNSSGESGNASPLEATPRLQQTLTTTITTAATTTAVVSATTMKQLPSQSTSGDLDDLPLNSRIPAQLKSPIMNQQTNQNVQELSETESSTHTIEHKIGGGRFTIYFILIYSFYFLPVEYIFIFFIKNIQNI